MRLRPAPLVVAVALALTASLQGQQPTFRSGVDLIRLDVQVVTGDGTPVTDLTENDFDIQVNGTPSLVRTLRFLDLTATETPTIELRSADVSTNAATTRGRLTVIVIDEDNLPDDTRPLMEGLRTYLKGLGPNDQAALVVLPRPGIWQDFTHDMGALQRLLKRSSSRADRDVNRNALTGSIPTAGIPDDPVDMKFRVTSGDVASDRGEFAAPLFNPQSAADPKRDLIYALQELARRLRDVEGPKTLLLVSAGLPDSVTLDDYRSFAEEAARARLTLYVLKPPALNATASSNTSALEKQFQAQNGLDFVVGMTGGVVLNAVGGAGGVFERITRETSGSYVIGVEPPPGAPRNKPLAVTVKVNEIVGVAGFALPGNLVDVMVNTKDDNDRPISKIVLEQIPVLAVAQEASRDETKPKVVNAVTLELAPEQAEKLDLARSIGNLSLVLRNQLDNKIARTGGARKNDLLQIAPVKGPIAPVKNVERRARPAEAHKDKVEMIKGVQRSTVEF